MSDPYRTASEGPKEPLVRRVGLWFCRRGHHSAVITKVLTGGAGPDDAAAMVECKHCKIFGWKYCDGSYGWRP